MEWKSKISAEIFCTKVIQKFFAAFKLICLVYDLKCFVDMYFLRVIQKF